VIVSINQKIAVLGLNPHGDGGVIGTEEDAFKANNKKKYSKRGR
jgi:4-hydroxy-L-threonine phosphate dehydrogenase PdxA